MGRPRQTHCSRGHELAPDNLIIRRGRQGKGVEERQCRRCAYDRNNERLRAEPKVPISWARDHINGAPVDHGPGCGFCQESR